MVEGLDIAQEHARVELYTTDQAHITATFCPGCGARLYKGKCQNECDLVAAYVVKIPPKPEKLCKIHQGEYSDFAHLCHNCGLDHVRLVRWEIRVGLRCEVCGKMTQYCEC